MVGDGRLAFSPGRLRAALAHQREAFERFERARNRGLGRETVVVPAERLSLRIVWEGTSEPVGGAWVIVWLADGHMVGVRATPGRDGLVRLPAIAPGPFPVVEVLETDSRAGAILRDVAVPSEPQPVALHRPR